MLITLRSMPEGLFGKAASYAGLSPDGNNKARTFASLTISVYDLQFFAKWKGINGLMLYVNYYATCHNYSWIYILHDSKALNDLCKKSVINPS